MSQLSAPAPEAPQYAATPPAPMKEKNTVGLIALVAAIVGFIFACIPGALIVGWVLLPVAFILSLVSFFMKGKKRGLGVSALIISVVGTVVGVVVFFSVVGTAFDDAFSNGEISVSAPAEETAAGRAPDAAAKEGTRANPYSLGSEIADAEWAVTINSVDLDAGAAVAAGNMFNEPAPEGEVYILVNATITYTGTDAAGAMPMETIEYVTTGGNTIHSYDSMVVAPDALNSLATLYEGASTTGNIVFSVPADSASDGVLAVAPSMFADKVFVAVQ